MSDPTLSPGTNPPHTLSTLNSYGERVDELARDLAAGLEQPSRRNRNYPLPARLRLLEEVIQASYRHFEQASRARSAVTQAAEWLLDNFYVIEQAFNQVREAMPAEFYHLLPQARFGVGSGMPRVYLLASALTRAGGGRLEAERLEAFVHAFQEAVPLTIGEIWALPIMLRLTALETLAEALADITQRPFERERRYFVPWPEEATGGSDPQPERSGEDLVVASILSLRLLATQDWKAFFEKVSLVEDLLREDPAGVYVRMDFVTRNNYRNEVEELGAGRAEDELRVARTILELARQGRSPHEQTIGHYLVGDGRAALEALLGYRPPAGKRLRHWLRRRALLFYLGSILAPTAGLILAVAGYGWHTGGNFIQVLAGVLLAAIPVSAAVVEIVHRLIVRNVPPRILPKLDFEQGVPDDYAAMVVIPALLSGEADVPSLLRQIETQYLGNDDPNIHFALLTDFTDALEEELPGDARLVEQASEGIQLLNAKYASDGYRPFLLFHRRRLWNPGEECWMGWERKRGKLEEFNRLLRGDTGTSYVVQIGDLDIISSVKYVITLDEDTLLPHGSAQRLIGTMAHPLNRAQYDPVTGVLTSGYSILQPRVQVRPAAANRSLFTRVYSGDSTLDLYTRAVSDVYQDLFGEGNFVGKGIYDVDAFERSLRDRVPENTLLSHDLFEGLHGRCGLVTDVVLYEGYPPHYLALTQRMHRWVRGDWQLLPWLGRKVPSRNGRAAPSDLSALDHWKIADNLRRSLLPPSVLMLLVAGWMFLPGAEAVWTVLALAGYLPGVVFSLLDGLHRRKAPDGPGGDVRPIRQALLRPLFEVIFLPHESLLISDAILTTLTRLAFTRKRLLQWVTAAHTVKVFGKRMRLAVVWREMIISPLFSLALLMVILAWFHSASLFTLTLLLGWMLSPGIAMYISRPAYREAEPLPPAQQRLLRRLARTTWLYFEHFVGPDDHWLPPDHFQEDPRGLVAHRTSPTNIGLLLLSTFSAYDLGYIGPQELVVRLRDTFDGMEQLERYRGHFLNWYDTRSLAPLSPRYVSTVDSGNLAASLMVVRQGCRDVAARPIVRWDGLVDTLDVLLTALDELRLGNDAEELWRAILQLRDQVQALSETHQCRPNLLVSLFRESRLEIETLLANLVESSKERFELSALRKLSTWVERSRHHLASLRRDAERFCPWSLALAEVPAFFDQAVEGSPWGAAWDELKAGFSLEPSLEQVPAICSLALERLQNLEGLLPKGQTAARKWCRSLEASLQSALLAAEELLGELQALSKDADAFVEAMDFCFLFDPRRQVFHIGYNAESGRLDSNFYDLLASEARIASLLAIGKGDVPSSHWLFLARPLTQLAGTRLLLSWSGTMFEYLMPVLFMKSYPNTLLDQSCRAATDRQISYGRENGMPWGISESSYYHFDASQIYQYRAFGVPGLGYKRGLGDDLVIAPYASVLALPFVPRAVVQNIGRFQKMKACGLYGLYEAVDFTPGRLAAGQTYALVRTYMAHHQGMILLSLSNYLLDGPAVRRFHADARVESVEFLLQEQTPQGAPVEYPHPQKIGLVHPIHSSVSLDGWRAVRASRHPQVHSLTNGSYSLLVTSSGAGYSRWGETDLTRWRADPTLDPWGVWLYVQDRENGRLWSAAAQPTGVSSDHREVRFFPHKVEFERRDDDISLHTRLAVAPDDDVEMRQVALTNHSDRRRRISLTSYGEVILAPQDVDQRHPAFNRLFIESEYLEAEKALLFRRRPRSQDEQSVYLAHFVVSDPPGLAVTGSETDRLRFIGRGGTPRLPAALQPDSGELSGSTGATLDPIFSLQVELSLGPYEPASLAFVTVAAASRQEAIDLIARYSHWPQLERAVDGAAAEAIQEMERLELTSPQVERFEKLLSVMLYPSPTLRADPATLSANRLGQSGLWPFAISGDHPILLTRLADGGLDLLRDLLQAHTYWRRRGLKIDLVILNRRETGYEQDLGMRIHRLLTQTGNDGWINKHGGIFILREDQMSGPERILLASAARAILDGEAGSLEQQLQELDRQPARLPRFVPVQPPAPPLDPAVVVERPGDLLFDNGLGGFTPDGREYVIYLNPGQQTPAPWINVIANPGFGFLVSESGMGCTWAQNSGENRLTPWHNDPVGDPPAEAIYLRDEDTGQVWSPTPLPTRAEAPYLVRHGAGYSTFEHGSHGLAQHMKLFAVPDLPLKIVQLKLENKTDRTRRINVSYYAEWVLGDRRENTSPHLVPEFDSRLSALLVCNPYHPEFGGSVAFLAATRELHGITTDRAEFLGVRGHYARPAALDRVGLTGSVRPGSDPCAVMQNLIWLAPGETKEVAYLLGQGPDRDSALGLIRHFQDVSNLETAWSSVSRTWDELLDAVQVRTPDPALDIMLNRWLLYQSLVCRVWGRTAFYQSGGAFGYRDQLQDVLALLHTRPALAREHILRAAACQFEEGDVLHWWHPPAKRGIRTRIADNLIWLPYVTARYVRATGDRSILDEQIPFLHAPPLGEGEHERYGHFRADGQSGSLYEHCRRALHRGATKSSRGLPLIGAGDWNDGMNRVGVEGNGESIWLGWFLIVTLNDFAELCDLRADAEEAAACREKAEAYRLAIENHGWDGHWYRRAYFDNGAPLGSKENSECRIDSISQSWAVISGAARPERARKAMQALDEELIRRRDGLLLLLTPPFDRSLNDPGYIKGYTPGVRENGGQYTHAALWAVWAFAELGDGDRAAELFGLLNPIRHADGPGKVETYRVEPYVIAADVYGAPPHVGRGGWTWYTGSASWMYRLGVEKILGLRRRGQVLQVDPCIPRHWPGFEVVYRFGRAQYRIQVENPQGLNRGIGQAFLDGAPLPAAEVPLVDDGKEHLVRFVLGAA